MDQIKQYYKVFKKFHAHDLPKTNYDIFKEERHELAGMTEQELLIKLNTEYKKLITQGQAFEKRFNVAEAQLYDHEEEIEEKLAQSSNLNAESK